MIPYLREGLGALAGATVIFGAMSIYDATVDDPGVRKAERAEVLAEARARALDLIEKRNKDDAEISTFDAAQLCVELGGRWVQPDNRCD